VRASEPATLHHVNHPVGDAINFQFKLLARQRVGVSIGVGKGSKVRRASPTQPNTNHRARPHPFLRFVTAFDAWRGRMRRAARALHAKLLCGARIP
jgi:hypothetical protein